MRKHARAGLALLTLVMTAGSVEAQVKSPQEQAKLREAVAQIKLRDRAEKGDAAAMVELGQRALVARDETEAVKWFKKAADLKDPAGQFKYGCALEYGWGGIASDEVTSLQLFEQAGKAGLAPAMMMAALTYDSPRTKAVAQDQVKAVYWYTQAAKHNEPLALRRLGQCSMLGIGGLKVDPKAAAKFYSRGAEAGDASCLTSLGLMHEKGIGGFAQNDAQALHLYRTAAEAGDLQAISIIAHAYYGGRLGLTKDLAKSTELFREAAKAGHPHSMMMLGLAYYTGTGARVNLDAAAKWLEKAIAQGDADAMALLGGMLVDGEGVKKDDARALKLFEAAAERRNPRALLTLAHLHQDGLCGLPRNPQKGFDYLKLAADMGYKKAHLDLGIAYANGNGVERNTKLAESSLQTMVKTRPDDPNSYGNYAWLLLGEGRIKEGLTQLDKAFSLTTEKTNPGIQVEIWYYTLAFRPQSRDQAIEHLRTLINEKQARSENWNFSRVTARALKMFPKHQDAKWLPVLADVIAGKADPSVLAEWPAWNKAMPQQATVMEKGTGE